MTIDEIYTELEKFIDSNDEVGARAFLTENINSFPEEFKNKVVLAFFEEGLTQKAEAENDIQTLQEDAKAAILSLEKIQRMLEDEKKIEDLKASL